jgi:class 3 adenylate cyclase
MLALVFTDIVDSTSLGNLLGDEKWVQLLLKHVKRARGLMYGKDCFEIKIIGDSFMVAFRTALEALDFALAFRDDTGDPSISIRVGIHVGPVRIIENDLFGMMVNYTKRVESAFSETGITLSDEAKKHIDYEKASRHATLHFKSYVTPFKGFNQNQIIWRVMTPIDAIADLFANIGVPRPRKRPKPK